MSDGFRLRAHETGDALAEARLLMRPAIRRNTVVFAPFTSEDEGRAHMERPIEGGLNIVAVSATDDTLIGHLALRRETRVHLHHTANVGIAVDEAWQGRGVGTALMRAMIETADDWLGILRITLRVFTDNAPAIALYEKMGFEREGLLRAECFRDGVYVDAYIMARLAPRLRREGA